MTPEDQALLDQAQKETDVLMATCAQIDVLAPGQKSATLYIQSKNAAVVLGQMITKERLKAAALAKLTDDERKALLGY